MVLRLMRSKHSEKATNRAPRVLLRFGVGVAMTCAFAGSVAACSSPAVIQKPHHVVAPRRSTPAQRQSAVKAAVAVAWRAGLEAQDDAYRTSNDDDPTLAATMTNPLLGDVITHLFAWHEAGDVAVGVDRVVQVSVGPITKAQAMVTACVIGDEIEVDGQTGTPLPGEPGRKGPVTYHVVMVNTPQGWKAQEQKGIDGPCASS
jgi:hypothetical protein